MNDEQLKESDVIAGEPKLTGTQRRKLRRDKGEAMISGAEQAEIDFSRGAKEMGSLGQVFPDTSKKHIIDAAAKYREQAHERKAKAIERRNKKNMKRRVAPPTQIVVDEIVHHPDGNVEQVEYITLSKSKRIRKKQFKQIGCPDCGKQGELKGHMDCPYPQN